MIILYWHCEEKFCVGSSWGLKGWRGYASPPPFFFSSLYCLKVFATNFLVVVNLKGTMGNTEKKSSECREWEGGWGRGERVGEGFVHLPHFGLPSLINPPYTHLQFSVSFPRYHPCPLLLIQQWKWDLEI